MYDTTKLWGNEQTLSASIDQEWIAQKLTNLQPGISQQTGEFIYSGNLDNLRVKAGQTFISVQGSLAKYFLEDNFQALTRKDTRFCIECLSDTLKLPMHLSKVTRLDVAQTFIMKYPLPVYFSHLGEARHYQRLEQPTSVYYKNGLRVFTLYDKVTEQKKKGFEIPELYHNRNGLRVEAQFLSRLCYLFNMASITGATLYNEAFYSKVLDRWKAEYSAIRKIRVLTMHPIHMKSAKDLEAYYFLKGIQASGGEQAALQEIELARLQGVFQNKMQATRLKKKIKEISQLKEFTSESEPIKELNRKVIETVKYYR